MPILFSIFLAGFLLASSGSPSTPTLAVEDTMRTEVAEVLVRAPRVTLDEIIDRVARGEARRESLLADQSFTGTVRMVRAASKRDSGGPVMETVWRVYRKKPDRVRSVLLRHWEAKRRKNDRRIGIQLNFSPGMGEEIVNFAFQASSRREFRYRIVGRDLVGDHVIYKIAFEPRSLLSAFSPTGVVWVNTNEFVIVRQEVSFRRSPIPVFVQSVPRMVMERRRVGSHWVLSRVLARVQLVASFPTVGRSFDMAIHYDDYRLNEGIADSLFVGGRP